MAQRYSEQPETDAGATRSSSRSSQRASFDRPTLSVTVQPRPALCAVLDSVVGSDTRGMVLVVAPAGTGKTTLLVDWIDRGVAGTEPAVAWITLDELDDDPNELTRRITDSVQSALAPASVGETDSESGGSLTECLRQVRSSGRSLVLVLDDAHVLSDEAALGRLADFLDAAPVNLTVVLSTRRSPALPLTRIAAEGELVCLSVDDLALDRVAAAAIFAEYRCVVSDTQLDAVFGLTGGWASAVRLAAIRLSTISDVTSGIADLTRYPQRISDYVIGQVLDGLPGELLRFAQATSVVDWFTPDLAEELDEAGVDRILAAREEHCIPLHRVVGDGELRYAWHPLLRAHLRSELRAKDPQRAARLHLVAARWLLASRRPVDALAHLIEASDDAAVEDFVFRNGAAVVFDGHAEEILDQLGVRYGDLPGVRYLRALAALEQNYPDAARAYLRGAAPAGTDCRHRDLAEAFSAALTVEIAVIGGQPMPADQVARLDGWTGSVGVDLDCYMTIQRSAARMFLGDLPAGERLLREALTLAEIGAHPRLILRCLARLSILAGMKGDLVTMTARAEHALQYAVDHGLTDRIDSFQCAAAVCMDSILRSEQLPADSAACAVVSANARHVRPDGTTAPASGGHAEVAFAILRARQTQAPSVADLETLAAAVIGLLGRGPQLGLSNAFVTPALAVLLDAGRVTAATDIVDLAESAFGEIPDVTVAHAMVLITGGAVVPALELLAPVLDSSRRLHPALAVRVWMLDAVIARRQHRLDDAVASIRRALALAEPFGIVSPFLDSAGDTAELLASVPAGGEHSQSFIDHVRTKIAEAHGGRNPGLTPSEKVVLGELHTGKQLRVIAKDLHVSLNTVRTHTRNLYRKLDSSSRAEAIETALRRGLI
ncbi:LuxR C-terminal-related transcriptional regulator [Prescottella defluvii]